MKDYIVNYVNLLRQGDMKTIVRSIIPIGLLLYITYSSFKDANKGGLTRVMTIVGQILATIVLTPITVLKVIMQVGIDIVTIVLTIVTGALGVINLTLGLIKQVLNEIAKLLIKNLPEDEDIQ